MDKRFLLLMAVFLTVALVPTIICILYPPQLAIIEQSVEPGIQVGLNNWYTTRDYPSAELPERFYSKLNPIQNSNIQVEQDSEQAKVKVQIEDGMILRCIQFYDLNGIHKQTTFLAYNKKTVNVEKLNTGEYWVLLDIDGTVYLKKVLIS